MPMTMKTEGVEEISRMLKDLGDKAQSAASKGLYKGAGIMAEEIKRSADGIRTAPFRYAGKGETRLPSPEEKDIVTGAGKTGIARFKKDGLNVETSVGYSRSGYADLKGRRKPIPLIANAINSGTSFMQKQAFFRQGVNRATKSASDAIRDTIEDELGAIIKE